jgi:hypothetical protein
MPLTFSHGTADLHTMDDRASQTILPSARWANRLAQFFACLLLIAVPLHRFGGLSTPVALNVFAVTLGGALAALLLGLYALLRIWVKGDGGALRASFAVMVAALMLAWPVTYYVLHMRLPKISDVSTDTGAPPRFSATASKRGTGANPIAYPGGAAAQLQQAAYPDLRTFVIDRSVEEAFDLVEEAVRRLRWKPLVNEPPSLRPAKAGIIELSEQTMIVGFWDDVVIRVEGSNTRARVDIRSASRYGAFDFGQNAARIRRFLVELQTRVDAAGPGGVRRLRTTRSGAMVKKGKQGDPSTTSPQNERDRAQPNAPRGREQKAPQR